MVLELYVGNDTVSFADTINFATGVNSTANNNLVTINGNIIWNAGNLTPQTQLNGTGFVKASGTTISYDNTNYLPLTGGTLTGQLNSNSNFNGANFFISSPTAQPATSASVGISANTTSGYLDITGYIYGLRIIQSATGAYGPTIATFENNGNITTTGGNTLEGVTNIKPNANFTITQNSVVPFTSVSSGAIVNSLYLTGRKAGFGTATPRTSASGSSNTLDVKGGIYFGSTASESCTINNDDSFICNFDADNSGGTSNFFAIAKGRTGESGGSEFFKVTGAGRTQITGSTTDSSEYVLDARNSTPSTLFFVRNDGAIYTGTASASPYNSSQTGRTAILASGGLLGYLVSTRESKANIESIKSIDFINELNPVQFNYRKKDDKTNTFTDEVEDNITYGFIADEVEKVNKELVFYNEDGTLAGVEYNSMIAILTKAIQEQQSIITSLQDRLDKAGL
jgi:hypothetical protein